MHKMNRDNPRYHWAERWRWVHGPQGGYMRRRTDGTVAASYYEAAEIEAAERGITRSQLLRTQRYKWLTLAEVTPPPVSEEADAEQGSPPDSRFDTARPIRNAHYHRTDVMTAQISMGFGLMVLGVLLALLSGLPILLSLACAILGGALLKRGLSN